MKGNSLQQLYIDELKDLYSAESQILKALPQMAKAATANDLRGAFEKHERQTREHIARLERMLKDMDQNTIGDKCVGMEGVIEETSRVMKKQHDPKSLDAALIAKAQHVEHYEIAGYGTCRAWAERLGLDQQADTLRLTLDEAAETDRMFTQLAERSINDKAAQQPATR
jgi:ferritin-like metal-binding protein YciE